MLQKLTAMKSKFLPNPVWRDFDEISDNFDLALSPEVIGWFHEQHGDAQTRQRALNRFELDEYELSLM